MIDKKLYPVVNKCDKRQYNIRGKHTLHTIKYLYHRSAHVFVETYGGIFILQKKAEGTENGGLWSSAVSGHVEAGETYRDTALREAEEELGLDLDDKDLDKVLKISPLHYEETGREFVTLFTYLMDPNKECININTEELDGLAFMSYKDLDDDISKNANRYSPVFLQLFDLFTGLKRSTL